MCDLGKPRESLGRWYQMMLFCMFSSWCNFFWNIRAISSDVYIQIRPWIWSFWSGWDTNICSNVPRCWNIYQHLPWKSPSFVEYTIHGASGLYQYHIWASFYHISEDQQWKPRFFIDFPIFLGNARRGPWRHYLHFCQALRRWWFKQQTWWYNRDIPSGYLT